MAKQRTRSNRKRKRRSFFATITFYGSWLLGLSIVLFICLILIYGYRASQFNMDKVAEIPAGATVYDSSGRKITTLKGGRDLADRQDLPEFLIDCLLAREDARFYEHGGVDWLGLVRATVRNLRDRSFTQGASTLSMQLSRNTYSIRAKSIDRKLLEIAITKRIEDHYSKNEILTHYLNRIYFGSGCYGIDSAAEKYFNRDVSKLSKGQSALLVGIIRGPHIFSPLRNLKGATSQRNQVLNRLIAQEKISKEEAEAIKAEPLYLQKKREHSDDRTYAVQAARRHLDEVVTDTQLTSEGLAIHTTLDLALQARVDTLIDDIFQALDSQPQTNPEDDLQCAAVVIENESGAIRALTGGRDFSKSKFNRALDAKRPLGPGFEVFLNALARERGMLPIVGNPVITARQLGQRELISLLPRLGLTGPYGEGDDIARGVMLSTPLLTATALTTLSKGGHYPRTHLIDSIQTHSGEKLFSNSHSHQTVLKETAAAEGLSLLGRDGVFLCDTNNARNIWIYSSSERLTSVIWLGYDMPKPIPNYERSKKSILNAAVRYRNGG